MVNTPSETTVALVSGANQGIGLAAATRLAKEHGYHVVVGSRNADAGAKVAASLQESGYKASSVQLDLSSEESISAAVKMIEETFGRLDVLVNNAGILIDGFIEGQSTRDLFNQTFGTNVIGTACLTEALLPLLRKSSLPRVVFVSSRMSSLAEATNKEMPFFHWDFKAYDASKAAVNMLALNYARMLEDAGALVNVACPGLVSTSLNNHNPEGATPEEGAQRIVELATLGKTGPTATFSDKDGSIPW
ncbi:NAD(P)-binding protein [Plenodomus tracheiphilus IPT5]|uniref:NAD(P)-binding protein n=1 Tax=Plenodomus tracheiphilus IPT5 TaxID=1408161 RepID=A0A6A7AV44_9PLEO|nr:NAD(P)-binding protein [Plenodomus tracheiphilus IPT5]